MSKSSEEYLKVMQSEHEATHAWQEDEEGLEALLDVETDLWEALFREAEQVDKRGGYQE